MIFITVLSIHYYENGLPKLPKNLQFNLVAWTPTLIAIAPVIIIIFSSRLLVSFHGPFHTAYINEIIQNTAPPPNVLLPETPANYYWLYHALLATISRTFALVTPYASIIVNLISLAITLLYARKLIDHFKLAQSALLKNLSSIFILFSANLLGWAYVLKRLAGDSISPSGKSLFQLLSLNPLTNSNDSYRLVISPVILKFQNFNGFPLGVAFFTVILYLFLKNKKKSIEELTILGILTVGSLFFHATTGIFIVLCLWLPWIGLELYSFYYNKEHYLLENKRQLVAPLILSILISYPALKFLYDTSHALPIKTSTNLLGTENMVGLILTTFPLIITIIIFSESFKKQIYKNKLLTLSILFGSICSHIFLLPDRNQYKFITLTAILLALFVLIVINSSKLRIKKAIIPILFFSVTLNIGAITARTIVNPLREDASYSFDKSQVISNSDYQEAYDWIGSNTDSKSLFITPLENKNESRLFISGERLAYVTKGDIYVSGLEEYQKRLKQIEIVYSKESSRQEREEVLQELKRFSEKHRQDIFFLIPTNHDKLKSTLSLGPAKETKNVHIYKLE